MAFKCKHIVCNFSLNVSACSFLMDESALEKYFDKFIGNLPNSFRCDSLQDSRSMEENEDFFSLLPDELLSLHHFCGVVTDETRRALEGHISNSPDYSSQNPMAAAGSPVPEPGDWAGPMLLRRPVMELPLTPQIKNITSSASLGCSLDLNLITHRAWNVEYNPEILKAIRMRIRKPRSTAVIYKNGSMVCMGANSEEQARLAVRRFARIVQKLGFPVSLLNFRIHSMQASGRAFPVSLERLVLAHRQHCSYEPELFPAVFYTVKPGVTVSIWSTGKFCIRGPKTQDEVHEVFDTILPILGCFRQHGETRRAAGAPDPFTL